MALPQQLAGGQLLARHRHQSAYAALVLAGTYEEAGDAGRFFATPGMLIVHTRFEAHLNRIGLNGATVLNLPLDRAATPEVRQVDDPDRVAYLAAADPVNAARLALSHSSVVSTVDGDWPELLAARLRVDPGLHLGRWASENGLALGSLSRGFGRMFGITPKRFRHEWRTRHALNCLAAANDSVAEVAADCGFADQAHLHRSVRALTGHTPRRVRAVG